MTSWQNDTFTKWPIDEMNNCQNGKLAKWRAENMTRWQNYKLTKWQVDKMALHANEQYNSVFVTKFRLMIENISNFFQPSLASISQSGSAKS